MAKPKESRAGILSTIDTKTKVLALIALIAEALFASSLPVVRADKVLFLAALITCALILIVAIVGIVIVEVAETRKSPTGEKLIPSPLTPKSEFMNDLINSAIQRFAAQSVYPGRPRTRSCVFSYSARKGIS